MIRSLLCAFPLFLGTGVGWAEPATPPPTPDAVTSALAAVRDQRTVQLITTGRKSGNPHAVTVWFMVDGPLVYLNTLDPTRDWVRNAQQTPAVQLDFGGTVLTGQLRTVTDPTLDATIRRALRDKYWIAWAGGLVGQGPKQTYVVEALHPVGP